MSSDRVMRWQLIIEEYGPEIKFIHGPENVVAYALSRLPMVKEEAKTKELLTRHIVRKHHLFVSRQNIPDECPLDMEIITRIQRDEMAGRIAKSKKYVHT